MDVNIRTDSMDEHVSLLPVIIYPGKVDIKKKIYDIVKRGIDIIGGIFGLILLIPLTIRNIYSTKDM